MVAAVAAIGALAPPARAADAARVPLGSTIHELCAARGERVVFTVSVIATDREGKHDSKTYVRRVRR